MTGSAGLVRVSVVAGERRADLALPGALPVAELLPELARAVGVLDGQTAYGGYSLLTSDGRTLSGDTGLTFQGVEDGGVLTISSGVDEEPPRVYDDIVEAMADAVENDMRPWEPAAGRRTALSAAALLLGLGALALALQRPDLVAGAAAGVAALVLLAAALVLGRVQHRLAAHPGDTEPGPAERGDQDDQPDQEDHHDTADPKSIQAFRGRCDDDHEHAEGDDHGPGQRAGAEDQVADHHRDDQRDERDVNDGVLREADQHARRAEQQRGGDLRLPDPADLAVPGSRQRPAHGHAGQAVGVGRGDHPPTLVGSRRTCPWFGQVTRKVTKDHAVLALDRNTGWQRGHQNRLRPASTSVRTRVPQTWQGCPCRR